MRAVLAAVIVLLLTACDVMPGSVSSTPDTIDSPFVTVQASPYQPPLVSTPTVPVGGTNGSTVAPDNSQPNTSDGDSSTGNDGSGSPVISVPSNGTTTSPAEAPQAPPQTQSPANLLYHALRNGSQTYETDSFWACSTQHEDGTFRMQLTARDRAPSYDVTNAPWGYAYVRIESDADDYVAPAGARGWIEWRVESANAVLMSSTRSDYSASNSRFTSIKFDQAGTRFSAADSNGVSIACARVKITSDPYCSYDSPYGACVLAPIGEGNDAIRVVREFAPTTHLINGNNRYVSNDFWQCTSDSGLQPFRFFFTGVTGITYADRDDRREPSYGVGWRYETDGSLFKDSALAWTADALGSVSFTTENGSRTERPLDTSTWSMFDIRPSDNGQTFQGADSRGFNFSCDRLVETVSGYSSCFHSPDTCPAR